MWIAIPVKEKNSTKKINEHFGQSNYYYLTDGEKGRFLSNPYLEESRDVGIQVCQWLAAQEVKVVIVRHIDINALFALHTASIKIFKTHQENVKGALDAFQRDNLQSLSVPGRISVNAYLSGYQGRQKRCVCLNCGYVLSLPPGLPCREKQCPKCGGGMRRLP